MSKLHDQGIYGKGVIVAVVDTGVAYRHPGLGGGFGPGFKVAKGYDLVGNGNGGPKVPDNDPDDQQGHGTRMCNHCLPYLRCKESTSKKGVQIREKI